jgi:hypothetical protein
MRVLGDIGVSCHQWQDDAVANTSRDSMALAGRVPLLWVTHQHGDGEEKPV